jgi:hypothetical protein
MPQGLGRRGLAKCNRPVSAGLNPPENRPSARRTATRPASGTQLAGSGRRRPKTVDFRSTTVSRSGAISNRVRRSRIHRQIPERWFAPCGLGRCLIAIKVPDARRRGATTETYEQYVARRNDRRQHRRWHLAGDQGPYQWGWLPIRRPETSRVSDTTTNALGSISRIRCLSWASSRKVITV